MSTHSRMSLGPRTIEGTDSAGRHWNGSIRSNDDGTSDINWRSNDGLSGSETVRINNDGTMNGTRSDGDVVPCDYDGKDWKGDCPSGSYRTR